MLIRQENLPFGLYPAGDGGPADDGQTLSVWRIFPSAANKITAEKTDALPGGERANLRNHPEPSGAEPIITAVCRMKAKVIMSSLRRQFSGTRNAVHWLMTCLPITGGVKYRPNNDSGYYYQSINADGSWGDEKLSLIYTVTIGAKLCRASLPTKGSEAFSLSSSGPWSFHLVLTVWC